MTIEYLRSFKIAKYAIFDLTVSFIGIIILSPILIRVFKYIKLDIPLSSWLLFTIPLSIFIHVIVGNITPLTGQILNIHGNYIIKIIILALIILGIKNVKIIK